MTGAVNQIGPPRVDLTPRQAAVRNAAFRVLLSTGVPVPPDRLAADLDEELDAVVADLRVLAGSGRVRLDGDRVLASAGLTLVRTNHRIGIDGAEWHTWCALDALGILGALAADGWIDSTNPVGDRFQLTFVEGGLRGPDPAHVLFVAGQREVPSVIDQWCPLVNFFLDERSAVDWAAGAGAEGRCLDLAAAAELASDLWRPVVARAGDDRGQSRSSAA